MKLIDFVVADAIVPELTSTQRDDVIRELVDSLVSAGALPANVADDIVKEIVAREKEGSTGFGKGIAVPHVKTTRIKKMVATIGVSHRGIDFKALDKAPVFSVVLLLSPKDQNDDHLQAMEKIFSNLQNDNFRRFLRQATSRKDIEELIHEADTQQLAG